MYRETATPDKSYIAVSIMSTPKRGTTIRQSIKFINRKGSFTYSPTCDKCAHQGKVQDNLGYGILNPSCDRDKSTWRSRKSIGYLKPQKCKYYQYICPHGYTDSDQCHDCCH